LKIGSGILAIRLEKSPLRAPQQIASVEGNGAGLASQPAPHHSSAVPIRGKEALGTWIFRRGVIEICRYRIYLVEG
jgi:hypothetical protein